MERTKISIFVQILRSGLRLFISALRTIGSSPHNEDDPDTLVFHLVKKADNVAKFVRRIKDKAGIEKDLTYHCSRHASATLAITAGADISSVKAVLGHGSVVSTEVYAKVGLDKKVQAMNLLNGVFD